MEQTQEEIMARQIALSLTYRIHAPSELAGEISKQFLEWREKDPSEFRKFYPEFPNGPARAFALLTPIMAA